MSAATARRSGWPGASYRYPGRLLSALPWLAPPTAALIVAAVLTQDVVPLRLALPIGAVVLVFAMRPRASTAIGLALVLIPVTALLRRITGGAAAFVPDDPLAVLALLAAAPAFAAVIAAGRRGIRPRGINWFAAYLIWVTFTSLIGSAIVTPSTRLTGLIGLTLAIVPAGIGYLVATGRVPGAERLTTHSLMVLPLLAGGYAVLQFFQPPAWDLAWLNSVSGTLTSAGVAEPQGFRVWGPMEAPLTLAIYLGLGLLAVLVLVIARRAEPGPVMRLTSSGLAAGLLLTALLLTSVRSVLFALPLLFVCMVLLNLVPGAKRYLVALVAVVVGGTAVGVGTFGLAPEGTTSDRYAIDNLSEDDSFQDRANLLPDFLEAFTNPFGSGAGSSGVAQRLSTGGDPIGVDNGYLTLVLEGGLVRLILFLALLGIGVAKAAGVARRNPRDPSAVMGILVLLFFALLHTSADVVSGALSIIFWIYLGAALRTADLKASRPGPVQPASEMTFDRHDTIRMPTVREPATQALSPVRPATPSRIDTASSTRGDAPTVRPTR